MNRSDVLAQANSLICNDRQEDYGDASEMFKIIASMWNSYLTGINGEDDPAMHLQGEDVAMMMALLKIARSTANPEKADSYIDLCGYAALGAELAKAE